jgi:UDP-N-acetylmuramate-alanine ligase
MCLETLDGVKEIDGFNLVVMDDLRADHPELFPPEAKGQMNYEAFEKNIRPNQFIYLRKDKNSLTFTLQRGPINEVGVNGCQVDTLVDAARIIIEGLNEKYPCEENVNAIKGLKISLAWLKERTKKRKKRGVEGKSER